MLGGCLHVVATITHILGSPCLGQNLNSHSKERIDMTIVYVCYSSSTSSHSKNTGSTPTIKLPIFSNCHNLPILISTGAQLMVKWERGIFMYVTAVDHILALRDLQQSSFNKNELLEVISSPFACRTRCPGIILWSVTFPISIVHPFWNLSFHTYASWCRNLWRQGQHSVPFLNYLFLGVCPLWQIRILRSGKTVLWSWIIFSND